MTARNRIAVVCTECSNEYEVIPSRLGSATTCSSACLKERRRRQMLGNTRAVGHGSNGASYGRGHAPWNKGVKGSIPANRTSFRAGNAPRNELFLGAITVRAGLRGSGPRRFIRTTDGWIEYARWLWEQYHGPLPEGHVVHHADRDSMHDVITNLVGITRAEHIRIHPPLRAVGWRHTAEWRAAQGARSRAWWARKREAEGARP